MQAYEPITDATYDAAIKQIEHYIEDEPPPGSAAEQDYFALSDAVWAYEQQRWPIPHPHFWRRRSFWRILGVRYVLFMLFLVIVGVMTRADWNELDLLTVFGLVYAFAWLVGYLDGWHDGKKPWR